VIPYVVTAAALATLTSSARTPPEEPVAPCITTGVELSCAIAGESPGLSPADVPRPVGLATDGRPGCVRGPGRPVVGTTGPAMSAVFTTAPSDVTFEYEYLDGTETVTASPGAAVVPGRPVVLGNDPDSFGPGESYRWRVRGTPRAATEPGWSDWCEFTVAAGLPDLREAEDADAVRELGLHPDRRYAVRLTVRQWRTVLDAFTDSREAAVADSPDLGEAEAAAARRLRQIAAAVRRQVGDPAGTPTRRRTVTLTGDEWAGLASEMAGWAVILDQAAAEEDPGTAPDGTATRAVVDLISRRLGGPPHPSLGTR